MCLIYFFDQILQLRERVFTMKKLLLSIFSAFFIVFLLNNDASAATMTDEELKKLRESGEDYTVELTYEQAVKRAAELSGKSVEQIKKENPQLTQNRFMATTSSGTVCSWMETFTTLNVTSSYKPKLSVILKGCRSGGIGWVDTNTEPLYIGIVSDSKGFKGDVEVDLEPTGFYYVINGKFYHDSETTHQGTTGANTVWTATYTVSTTSSFYASYYSGLKWRSVGYY
jgi:hypothetical protein